MVWVAAAPFSRRRSSWPSSPCARPCSCRLCLCRCHACLCLCVATDSGRGRGRGLGLGLGLGACSDRHLGPLRRTHLYPVSASGRGIGGRGSGRPGILCPSSAMTGQSCLCRCPLICPSSGNRSLLLSVCAVVNVSGSGSARASPPLFF